MSPQGGRTEAPAIPAVPAAPAAPAGGDSISRHITAPISMDIFETGSGQLDIAGAVYDVHRRAGSRGGWTAEHLEGDTKGTFHAPTPDALARKVADAHGVSGRVSIEDERGKGKSATTAFEHTAKAAPAGPVRGSIEAKIATKEKEIERRVGAVSLAQEARSNTGARIQSSREEKARRGLSQARRELLDLQQQQRGESAPAAPAEGPAPVGMAPVPVGGTDTQAAALRPRIEGETDFAYEIRTMPSRDAVTRRLNGYSAAGLSSIARNEGISVPSGATKERKVEAIRRQLYDRHAQGEAISQMTRADRPAAPSAPAAPARASVAAPAGPAPKPTMTGAELLAQRRAASAANLEKGRAVQREMKVEELQRSTAPTDNAAKIKAVVDGRMPSAELYRSAMGGPSGQRSQISVGHIRYTPDRREGEFRVTDREGRAAGWVSRTTRNGEERFSTYQENYDGGIELLGWADSLAHAADVLVNGENAASTSGARNSTHRRISGNLFERNPNRGKTLEQLDRESAQREERMRAEAEAARAARRASMSPQDARAAQLRGDRNAPVQFRIPFEATAVREQAKKLGATWDKENKTWHVPADRADQVRAAVEAWHAGRQRPAARPAAPSAPSAPTTPAAGPRVAVPADDADLRERYRLVADRAAQLDGDNLDSRASRAVLDELAALRKAMQERGLLQAPAPRRFGSR